MRPRPNVFGVRTTYGDPRGLRRPKRAHTDPVRQHPTNPPLKHA